MAPVHKTTGNHRKPEIVQTIGSSAKLYHSFSNDSFDEVSLGERICERKLSDSSQDPFQATPSDEGSIRDEEEDRVTDLTQSETSSSSSRDPNSKTSGRSPNCAACRNHGKTMKLKGHKRHCRYKNCECVKCELTMSRRKIMASSVKMTRDLKQDLEQGNLPISEPVLGRGFRELGPLISGAKQTLKTRTVKVGNELVTYVENPDESVTVSKHIFESLIFHQNLRDVGEMKHFQNLDESTCRTLRAYWMAYSHSPKICPQIGITHTESGV